MPRHALRIEAVSEDSDATENERYEADDGDISLYQRPPSTARYSDPFADRGIAPQYPPEALQTKYSASGPSAPTLVSRETLPHFASFDRDWWLGGHSADGRAYTQRTPEDYSQYYEETPNRCEAVDSQEVLESQVTDRQASGKYGHTPHTFHAADHDDARRDISDAKKRKRMRLLEREFGADPAKTAKQEIDRRRRIMTDTVIGSIDRKANLITSGPKLRLSLRWLQGFLCAACVGASIGVSLVGRAKSGHKVAQALKIADLP